MADDIPRVEWFANLQPGPDEPLFLSLIKYRMDQDRWPVVEGVEHMANLVSSHIHGSKLHAPILDLDVKHVYIESTTEGHAHLYLPPMKRWRMFVMLLGLRVAGVVEMGNFWWAIRRGGTFVRKPNIQKQPNEELRYSYGMFFKLKEKR